jgi:hypothetical protein
MFVGMLFETARKLPSIEGKSLAAFRAWFFSKTDAAAEGVSLVSEFETTDMSKVYGCITVLILP